jgi:DNA polymerase V
LDYMEDRIDMKELLVQHPLSTFFIRVDGDSMKDACIPDKSLIVVDRSLKAVTGSIVVAVIDNQFTVKRLVKTPRAWVLHAENTSYKPIVITEDMELVIWGVVIKVIINLK